MERLPALPGASLYFIPSGLQWTTLKGFLIEQMWLRKAKGKAAILAAALPDAMKAGGS